MFAFFFSGLACCCCSCCCSYCVCWLARTHFSPLWWLSQSKCPYILWILVCGKEILLFLCVVVEYISLRVRIIYCLACSHVSEPCVLLSAFHVNLVPNIDRFLIINAWECWIIIAFNKFRHNLFSHCKSMTSFIACRPQSGRIGQSMCLDFKEFECSNIKLERIQFSITQWCVIIHVNKVLFQDPFIR